MFYEEPEFITESVEWNEFCNIQRGDNLSFLTINARSISNKFPEFLGYLAGLKHMLSFILVTETWLCESNDFLFEIPGYTSFNFYRKVGRGGGLKLFVKQTIACKSLEVPRSDSCETLVVSANIPGLGFVKVCGFNRPPQKNVPDFLT